MIHQSAVREAVQLAQELAYTLEPEFRQVCFAKMLDHFLSQDTDVIVATSPISNSLGDFLTPFGGEAHTIFITAIAYFYQQAHDRPIGLAVVREAYAEAGRVAPVNIPDALRQCSSQGWLAPLGRPRSRVWSLTKIGIETIDITRLKYD